ncbi:HNH endonuclease [Rhizobium leguminosarum]|uniref:HNH endonuclease n=1 Tax=Rhizobium leguminosarum TaxID=384 RepID=UPI001F2CA3D4|nr:HNH endonuclease [Rhizobium leguminosarum]UIJ81823.1 HNH endonuclease [Rhizobium leguminosarum]
MVAHPTIDTILETIEEYRDIGTAEFVKRYAWGQRPQQHYIRHQGALYPMRSVWAASCRPQIGSSTPQSTIVRGFRRLGFELVDVGFLRGEGPNPHGEKVFYEPGELLELSADRVAEERAVMEGLAYTEEIRFLMRDPRVVEKAKKDCDYRCEVCEFDFLKTYGEIGKGYIEAHHIFELAERAGENAETKPEDLAMLCSNCHSMIHRKKPCYSVDELKHIMRQAHRWIL